MSIDEKISGPVLLGFGDLFEDEIGSVQRRVTNKGKVATQRKPPSLTQRPTGPTHKPGPVIRPGNGKPSGLPRSSVMREHGKSLGKGRKTALSTVKTLGKAKEQLAKGMNLIKKRKNVSVGADGFLDQDVFIGGDTLLGYISVGVVADKKLTPKQKAAIRKHNTAQAKADKTTRALAQEALKVRSKAATLAKNLKSQKQLVDGLRKKRSGTTAVRGIDLMSTGIGAQVAAVFDEFYTQVGSAPDPLNPGFLDDGTPDPAFQTLDSGPSADTSLDSLMDQFGEIPGDSDVELPPPPPMDTLIPDAAAAGGIVYDGSKGYPNGYAGSYSLMYRTGDRKSVAPKTAGIDPVFHYGYVWGKFWDRGPEQGIPFGDKLPDGCWNHVHGRWILTAWGSTSWKGGGVDERVDIGTVLSKTYDPDATKRQRNPDGTEYGPIVGNPNLANFKGMRCDAKGVFFWLPQEAPDWLTFPLRQAAALTAKADKEAAEAKKKADAIVLQQQRDLDDAETARQEAEMAMAERQADSEAKIAETQQAAQAQQVLLQQAQVEQQQQSSDMEMQKSAMQLMLEQARADMERQKQMDAMQMQFQAEMAKQGIPPQYMPMDEEAPVEEEYDPGMMADGSPIPGADVMRDADGEGYAEGEYEPGFEE